MKSILSSVRESSFLPTAGGDKLTLQPPLWVGAPKTSQGPVPVSYLPGASVAGARWAGWEESREVGVGERGSEGVSEN